MKLVSDSPLRGCLIGRICTTSFLYVFLLSVGSSLGPASAVQIPRVDEASLVDLWRRTTESSLLSLWSVGSKAEPEPTEAEASEEKNKPTVRERAAQAGDVLKRSVRDALDARKKVARARPDAVEGVRGKPVPEKVDVKKTVRDGRDDGRDRIRASKIDKVDAPKVNTSIADDSIKDLDKKLAKKPEAWDKMGIKKNHEDDFNTFVLAVITNAVVVIVCLLLFSYLRPRLRLVYGKHAWDQWGQLHAEDLPEVVDFHIDEDDDDDQDRNLEFMPRRPSTATFSWIRRILRMMLSPRSSQGVMNAVGLDQAMLLEFARMGMNTFALLGTPMLLIVAPVHIFFGGDAAGNDMLSWQGFANVKVGNQPVCWMHAIIVWIVVFYVDTNIYNLQEKFVELRVKWLHTDAKLLNCTVLVEGVPTKKCTHRYIRDFFNKAFETPGTASQEVVDEVHVVIHTENLTGLIDKRSTARDNYQYAAQQQKLLQEGEEYKDWSGSTVQDLEAELKRAQDLVLAERARLREEIDRFDQHYYESESEEEKVSDGEHWLARLDSRIDSGLGTHEASCSSSPLSPRSPRSPLQSPRSVAELQAGLHPTKSGHFPKSTLEPTPEGVEEEDSPRRSPGRSPRKGPLAKMQVPAETSPRASGPERPKPEAEAQQAAVPPVPEEAEDDGVPLAAALSSDAEDHHMRSWSEDSQGSASIVMSTKTDVEEEDHGFFKRAKNLGRSAGVGLVKTIGLERALEKKLKPPSPMEQEMTMLFSTTAFVTFKSRLEATMAARLCPYTADKAEWQLRRPPDPGDVIWTDFLRDPVHEKALRVVGLCLIGMMFFLFLPTIGAIARYAKLENIIEIWPNARHFFENSSLAKVWNGLAGAMALSLVLGFIPTILMLISHSCFKLRAAAWAQLHLQRWYFTFLLVFQLIVVSFTDTLYETMKLTVKDPLMIARGFSLGLCETTHFFLSIFVLQWASTSIEMLRIVQLFKYLAFKKVYDTPQEAAEKSEPEDQDYYGIGARNARYTSLFVMGVTFISLCPLMAVVAWINFFLIYLCIGYSVVFAETKKPDLGGEFWVQSLKHIQVGLIFYIAGMTGVLIARANDVGPGLVAGSAAIYMMESMVVFKDKFQWKTIPHMQMMSLDKEDMHPTDMAANACVPKRTCTRKSYLQPELCDSDDDPFFAQHFRQSSDCTPRSAAGRSPRLGAPEEEEEQSVVYMSA